MPRSWLRRCFPRREHWRSCRLTPRRRDEDSRTEGKGEKKAAPPTKPSTPPTYADVPYGDHPRQRIDFYQAESTTPTPLVVFLHGGSWTYGDKWALSALK